jgi:hypothetical protein
MRRITAFSGFVVVALFGLSGCGRSESSNEGADGAQPGGGKTSGSFGTGLGGTTSPGDTDGTGGAGGSTASCPGPNPAARACRSSADACVPSGCRCVVSSEVLVWECTADCRTTLPLCPDGGTVSDSGISGVPCGNRLCSSAEYCCNVNCGQCAHVAGDCTNQDCELPPTWACTNDSDCTAWDDYCGGCNCQVLGLNGHLGTCTKGLVACFVAPCATKSARCENGRCTLVTN